MLIISLRPSQTNKVKTQVKLLLRLSNNTVLLYNIVQKTKSY